MSWELPILRFQFAHAPRLPDMFENAAVADDPLLDVPVALPLDNGAQVALVDHLLDQRKRVVVVRPAVKGI
jgi:hypothetical protein